MNYFRTKRIPLVLELVVARWCIYRERLSPNVHWWPLFLIFNRTVKTTVSIYRTMDSTYEIAKIALYNEYIIFVSWYIASQWYVLWFVVGKNYPNTLLIINAREYKSFVAVCKYERVFTRMMDFEQRNIECWKIFKWSYETKEIRCEVLNFGGWVNYFFENISFYNMKNNCWTLLSVKYNFLIYL